jgi:hypothetical protein
LGECAYCFGTGAAHKRIGGFMLVIGDVMAGFKAG